MLQGFVLVILGLLGVLLSRIAPQADLQARLAFGLGFFVVTAYLAGEIASRFSVPKITGYLLAGLLFGPFALAVVDHDVVSRLKLVDELALCFIAFAAGGELEIRRLWGKLRAMVSVALFHVLVVVSSFAVATLLVWKTAGDSTGLTTLQILEVGVLVGLIAYPTGLASTMGVVLETRARGPVSETVLGTTIIKELVDIILFSVVFSLAVAAFGGGADFGVGRLVGQIALSVVVGGAFGLAASFYFEKVGRDLPVFILGLTFFMIVISHLFHFELLVVAMTAGFVVRNLSRQAARFLESLEHASGPVFIVFFAIAGAGLDIHSLGWSWLLAIGFVMLRAAGLWSGTWLGVWSLGRRREDFVALRKYGWFGFLGHAGLSLGELSLLVAALPQVASRFSDIIVAAVLVSEVVGPVTFKWALGVVGEGRMESRQGGVSRLARKAPSG